MPRVLHLIKALGRGGAEVLLTEGLAVADRNQFLYSYAYLQSQPDDVAADLRVQRARVHCFHIDGNLQMLIGARRIARYLQEQDIDIVHAHLPVAGVVARLAGRLAEVPVVYTEHCPIESYHPLVRGLGLLTWRWQERVVAISEDVADSIRANAGEAVPVQTVWNGVNTKRFSSDQEDGRAVRSALGIPSEAPVIGTVAVFRDTPQKRLDVWLEVAQKVRAEVPGAQFILVGDGSLRGRLEGQAEILGLGDVAHFVGRQSDVRPYLAAMDVFLMSSAYEGFGLAPVEAMAMEVAVVATDVEGVRNVVTSGETGLLAAFDERVADTLSERTIGLIRDPERRRALASAGRRDAVARFSIVRMQRELEAIYEQALAGAVTTLA